MDASASSKIDTDFKKILGYYLEIDNETFPEPTKQRSAGIKYTKLPDQEPNTNVSWPQENYYQQPRVRRVITLKDEETHTTRSLKPNVAVTSPAKMSSSVTKRKIVTIAEDDENDLHPRFYRDRKPCTIKTSNRSVSADFKDEKQCSPRSTSRLSTSSKNSRVPKTNAKTSHLYSSRKVNVTEKQTCDPADSSRSRNIKEKGSNRNTNTQPKNNASKNVLNNERGKNIEVFKQNVPENNKNEKKPPPKSVGKAPTQSTKSNVKILKEIQSKRNPVTTIHVPLEEKSSIRKCESKENITKIINKKTKVDCATDMEEFNYYEHVNTNTDPHPETKDQMTSMSEYEFSKLYKCMQSTDVQTDIIKETFDSLEIPKVALTKETKDHGSLQSTSLPNMKIPSLEIISDNEERSDLGYCKSSSYIISRATLTYTTKQKINIHVVSSSDETSSVPSPSPMAYPINVMSVLKNEFKNIKSNKSQYNADHNNETNSDDKAVTKGTKCCNELKSFYCSYDVNKLMKPSDIISAIKVNSLLQSDYVCEQFQRELNFIDSFFESLQYLENCSLSNKSFPSDKVESLINNPILYDYDFDPKNSDYTDLLPKFEDCENVDDTETMASKSLCLLNLLIRDEQRRAKNLLFVLKMREDALKDFTKSQILWLENKKKHENTDVSTLKKKQRGALLKLQHECGEMHRMRKALLTLSEKRKVALMKTKKNIELKLKNNVDVEQLLEKKKLKRNSAIDRYTAPLKCFDLSSSGCEDSTTSRPNSEVTIRKEEISTTMSVKSAEKYVQTGDSILETSPVSSTEAAAENFVAVDGGYLNIIFQNLSLPQIFSNGKQYEVNEEALKNIVQSTNTEQNQLNGAEVVEKLMNQIKNRDLDKSSSPSTARSLVDEFDQYYKNFVDEEQSAESSQSRYEQSGVVCEFKDEMIQVSSPIHFSNMPENYTDLCTPTVQCSEEVVDQYLADDYMQDLSVDTRHDIDFEIVGCQNGPLPVPAGAAYEPEPQPTVSSTWPSVDLPIVPIENDSSSQTIDSEMTLSPLASPVLHEAEELRRQQLAIEREIKALEQEQSRLLVVREIPDKPPPPYTPPIETRVAKSPRMFFADENTGDAIHKHVISQSRTSVDPTDPYEVFVKDFCDEIREKQKMEQSDKPWDACNLLPHKPQTTVEKLAKKTSNELLEVLTGVTPTVVSGIANRRSDHIDDILFAEWRRCEPEWTSLHTDEAAVKNQIFECIFQRIITETVDGYNKTVMSDDKSDHNT